VHVSDHIVSKLKKWHVVYEEKYSFLVPGYFVDGDFVLLKRELCSLAQHASCEQNTNYHNEMFYEHRVNIWSALTEVCSV